MTRENLYSYGLSSISDKEFTLCAYKNQDRLLYGKVWDEVFDKETISAVEEAKKRTWNEILCDNNQLYLKILDKQTGEFWGEISLKDLGNDIPELGIHILREYRNKGIGTKVVKCLIKNLRRIKGVQCLLIRIYSDNYVSQRLFEHLGAVKIGEEGKAYCEFMKKMMQDMGKEKFEKIIQGAYEDTQRYILCYRLDL